MISKMKKLTFLVYHKEYDSFLESIRELGVVHIFTKSQGVAENAELQENIRLTARYTAAMKYLKGLGVQSYPHAGNAEKGAEALKNLDEMQQQMQQLTHQMQALDKEVVALEPWGNFEPINLSRLREAGYQVDFYICSEKLFKQEWVDLYNATVVNQIGSKLYFMIVTPVADHVELEVEYAKLPECSLSQLKANQVSLNEEKDALELQIKKLAETAVPDMEAAQRTVYSQIELSKVVLSTDTLADNKLMLLEGWIPVEKVDEMQKFLNTQEAYYEMVDPVPGDNVPIQLNNTGFFKLFEPIMRLYMLPKYNELDLTPFFAPFFMLFFGLCLGDSGYGSIMFFGIMIYRLFAKNIEASMKSILSLVQLLGLSTMLCGLLTGTCLGFNLYEINIPFFQSMKELISLDNQQMFNLSLILGGVQIIFGMILKAINQTIQFGIKYAVATIGWLFVLVSTAIAFAAPGLMGMGSTVHMVIAGVGLAMAFLYNSPDKNIFVNVGLGLWDSYNMCTGLLGDILSYVRLFALGLSGGILASVFNSLAVGMSPDNVIAGPIVMVLIFVIGHSINMFMNVLGAMVHPMRLTFVEFFKNAGYEGGGKEYTPFKK